jgi:hypothetical protein
MGYVRKATLVAEKVLKKLLPMGAVIHHANGNRQDNQNGNLVICQNDAYHNFLHVRKRAFESSGFAHYRKCRHCKKYDDPKNMKASGSVFYHHVCSSQYWKNKHKDK